MNLKESFRYQKFLDGMMRAADYSLQNRDHCLITTKTHLRSKANPEAADITETVEVEEFFDNDIVLQFMQWLVEERNKLTTAIGKAKAALDFDIDAAIETNKFRQQLNASVKSMLRFTPRKTVEQGRDYKFNLEGNQTAYIYDVEIVSTEAYDKVAAKYVMRSMIAEADRTSAMIDAAQINTVVDYMPVYDVNESFEDVMEAFKTSVENNGET